MRKISFIEKPLLLLLLFFMVSCVKEPQARLASEPKLTEEEQADSVMQVLEGELEASYSLLERFANYGESFKLLVGGFEHTVRSLDLDMMIDEVKNTETATLIKEAPEQLAYKVDFNETEYANLHYRFSAEDRLAAMRFEVFLSDSENYAAMLSDTMDFFTRKYGKHRQDTTGEKVWQVSKEHALRMQGITKPDTFSIVIEIK